MEEQKRGQLTDRIKVKSKELLGYEIGTEELRLMVYVHYVMTNDQKLGMEKVSQEERGILTNWKVEGYIEGGASGLTVTKEFWDILSEIIFLGYVDLS